MSPASALSILLVDWVVDGLDILVGAIDSVIDWTDTHSGFVILLATLALVLVTAMYVKFTHDLAKSQQAPLRREILEDLIPDLEGMIFNTLHDGLTPDSLATFWRKTRHSRSSLVYTPLFPRSLRNALDRLADEDNMEALRDYDLVRDAAKNLSLAYPPKDVPRPEEMSPGLPYRPLWKIYMASLGSSGGVADVIPLKDQVEYTWTNLRSRSGDPEYITRDELRDRLETIATDLTEDQTVVEAIARHRKLLKRIDKMREAIASYRKKLA